MSTILSYVCRSAASYPHKTAIIAQDGTHITYADLYQRMLRCEPLPIPLLGESWASDFHLTTTGTTGKSKTVVITQEAVVANSENLIHAHGYTSHTVFVIVGALDHLGSWSKIFPTLMLGGTLILLDGMRDINAFFAALDYDSSHLATFLVPANIRILLQFSAERLATYADKIEFIETGAAPMARIDMLKLCELLPNTRLFNTYASTETGIVCTYNFNDGITKVGCCGRPMMHSHVSISPEGHIVCSGKTLMKEYLGEPQLTATILKDNSLYTADNGYIDQDGMLHIQGRNDDVINVGGYKVDPVEVENRALEYPGVEDCICISEPHEVLGNILKLIVKYNSPQEFNKRHLAQFIHETLETYKVPQRYELAPSIHRTFNGKLNRRAYTTAE